MRFHTGKHFRDMTSGEQRRYQALCRLHDRSRLLYLLFFYGLTRQYRRITDGQHPFALLSAQTQPGLCELERTRQLRTQIKDLGLGYLPARCVWVLVEGEVLAPGAIFVQGATRDIAVELGRTYGQSSLIWSPGPAFWRISPLTGAQAGPFPTTGRLRQLVLERLLEREVEEMERHSKASKLVVGPGRRGFFFWRYGGGLITCGHAPCGVSVHDVTPGAKLHADYDDCFMEMGSIDGYLPL